MTLSLKMFSLLNLKAMLTPATLIMSANSTKLFMALNKPLGPGMMLFALPLSGGIFALLKLIRQFYLSLTS